MIRPYCQIAVLAMLLSGRVALSNPQDVQFDIRSLVGCKDVTSDEFSRLNPDEKLIEARFQISSLVRHGKASNVVELMYRIENPSQRMEVIDYLPRTTLSSEVIGNVGVEKKQEDVRSIGISILGKYNYLINADASGTASSQASSSLRYETLPAMEVVAASGTTSRGTGAYFKLRPSRQTSLEGAKDFGLVLRVSQSWRLGIVIVYCRALTMADHLALPPSWFGRISGMAMFPVVLYRDGDIDAKQLALQVVRAESVLRHVAAADQSALEKHSFPTVAHRVGKSLSIVDAKIPAKWLEQLLQWPSEVAEPPVVQNLPPRIQRAARDYLAAKRALANIPP